MPKARENASDQVVMCLILQLIDHESNASSLNQSQSEVKQKTKQFGLLSVWLLRDDYSAYHIKGLS